MPSTKQRFPHELENACTLNRQKPVLKLDQSRLLLVFKRKQTEKKVQNLLTKNGLPLTLESPFEDPDTNPRSKSIINHTDRRFWVRTKDKKPLSETVQNSLRMKLKAHLAWIAPVYQMPDIPGRRGVVAPVADTLLVKPRRQESVTDPDTLLAVSTELRKMKCDTSPNQPAAREPDEYVPYRVKNPEEGTVYTLKLEQLATPEGPIDAVHLDYMPLLSTVTQGTAVTQDPLSGHQWSLSYTNWDKVHSQVPPDTLGRGVIVAVIDKGCDRYHPDLQGSFAGGATIDGSIQIPEPRGKEGHDELRKSHGTSVAGIIAARCDNQIGIAGLAPGCQIMPIRLNNETAGELAEAIKFAHENNAKVINISMATINFNTPAVRAQIRIAASKNVVICAAAGNDGGSALSYPAADVNVIACSAIIQTGTRCTTADWGLSADANYGPGLSVVAPGVAIPTTQHSSGSGRHRNADYAYAFEGTSAAAPHVAALATILLSMKPGLSPSEVRDIIEGSTQQLPGYTFNDTPEFADGTPMPGGSGRKGWSRQVGYGLIDFEAAITKARRY